MTSNPEICVIGNSHVGMLLASSKSQPVSLSVVAKPGLEYDELKVIDGQLVAKNDELRKFMKRLGLKKTSSVLEFDLIVIVAMNASAFSAVRLLQAHDICTETTQNARAGKLRKRSYISKNAYLDALSEMNRMGTSWRIAQDLRRATSTPIVFIPQPQPSNALLRDKSRLSGFHRMHGLGIGKSILDYQNDSFRHAFAEISNSRTLIQPLETLENGFLTSEKFSRGATRVDGRSKQPETDILHANEHLGNIYWRQILSQIEP